MNTPDHPTRWLAAAALVAVCLAGVPHAGAESPEAPPPWVACAFDPDGFAEHCRCLPDGRPVESFDLCAKPASTTPTTDAPAGPLSVAPVFVPGPADLNDLPVPPAPVAPSFTG